MTGHLREGEVTQSSNFLEILVYTTVLNEIKIVTTWVIQQGNYNEHRN